jgi:membrane-associated protease RseP (regulator of RpoE activity)
MRKSVTLGIVFIIYLIALLAVDRTAFAQAGSTGGTIGKTDKSVSGGEDKSVSRGEEQTPPASQEQQRGWLGVQIQPVTDDIADGLNIKPARGALVAGVDDKGPAKPAGIESGDVIVKFDGKEIKEMRDLPRIVADTPVGKDVDVVILRKGKEENKTVKLGRLEGGSPEGRSKSISSGEEPEGRSKSISGSEDDPRLRCWPCPRGRAQWPRLPAHASLAIGDCGCGYSSGLRSTRQADATAIANCQTVTVNCEVIRRK